MADAEVICQIVSCIRTADFKGQLHKIRTLKHIIFSGISLPTLGTSTTVQTLLAIAPGVGLFEGCKIILITRLTSNHWVIASGR